MDCVQCFIISAAFSIFSDVVIVTRVADFGHVENDQNVSKQGLLPLISGRNEGVLSPVLSNEKRQEPPNRKQPLWDMTSTKNEL